MSAAPTNIPSLRFPQDAPDDDWLPLKEAAPLLGVTDGHLRRGIHKIAAKGHARQFTINGGKAWHLHRDHDDRLAKRSLRLGEDAAKPIEADPIDLAAIDPPRRETALKRLAAVAEYRKRRDTDPGFTARTDTAALCERLAGDLGIRCSVRSLHRWHAACPDITDANRAACVLSLLDGRTAGGGRRSGITPAAWKLFEQLYLTEQRRSVKVCFELVRKEAQGRGWSWPSLSAVRRAKADRITPEQETRGREGETAWKRTFQLTMAQDEESHGAGERWDGDHATLDFYIRVRSGSSWSITRPTLTAWMDWRSRRLVGWHIDLTPSSFTIRQAMVCALRDPAISLPQMVKIDHGKDYESEATTGKSKKQHQRERGSLAAPALTAGELRGLLPTLGIDVSFGTPYSPNSKARIERLFGTIHERFDREQPSYIGEGPTAVSSERKAELKKNLMSLPTIEQVRERFAAFVPWLNGRGDHAMDDLVDESSGERLSPAAYYDAKILVRRPLSDPNIVELLALRYSRAIKAGKKGVGFTPPGTIRKVYFGELCPELRPYMGHDTDRVVIGYDPADLSRVRCFDAASGAHIVTAPLNGVYGAKASAKAIGEAQREKRRQLKAIREANPAALLESDADAIVRAQREDDVNATHARLIESGITPTSDAPVRIVRTVLDGQADEIEQQDMRLAAGAEHDAGLDDSHFELPTLSLTDDGFDDDDDDDDLAFDDDAWDEERESQDQELDDEDEDEDGFEFDSTDGADADDEDDDVDLIHELGRGGGQRA